MSFRYGRLRTKLDSIRVWQSHICLICIDGSGPDIIVDGAIKPKGILYLSSG